MSAFMPERLRGFIAARLWERADRYMHLGPSGKVPENFLGGSYAGNTDLLPLLELITALVPEEPAPWHLLADNFGKYLGKKDLAVKTLQKAILANRHTEKVHELFAAIAYLKIFAGTPDINEKKSAIKYLSRATVEIEKRDLSEDDKRPGFDLSAYQVLLSRLYLETGDPEMALESWKKSGLPLNSDQGKLAELLIEYKETGEIHDIESLFAREKETEKSELPKDEKVGYEKNLQNNEKTSTSLARSIYSLIVSFILFAAVFALRFRFS
ncbi:MAG: hypothetical protein Kow0029_28050 [Candidatus Rifleibacteriota bacterium]